MECSWQKIQNSARQMCSNFVNWNAEKPFDTAEQKNFGFSLPLQYVITGSFGESKHKFRWAEKFPNAHSLLHWWYPLGNWKGLWSKHEIHVDIKVAIFFICMTRIFYNIMNCVLHVGLWVRSVHFEDCHENRVNNRVGEKMLVACQENISIGKNVFSINVNMKMSCYMNVIILVWDMSDC